MGFDDFINLFHQPSGFGEGDDDLVVVGDVLVGEGAAFAILEPFRADLVAADVEVPDVFRDAVETGSARGGRRFLAAGVEPDGAVGPAGFEDELGGTDEFGERGVSEVGILACLFLRKNGWDACALFSNTP